jgi:hypothetical protein
MDYVGVAGTRAGDVRRGAVEVGIPHTQHEAVVGDSTP